MGRELGRFVEARRHELGLTRKDVVARSGLSYPYVSQIETGDREPALKALSALAGALEVSVTQLAELLSGDSWTGGTTQPRAMALGSLDRAPVSTDRPSSERVDEKALYALERRLRDVPPLERLALLNRLIALTIDELGEQQR